MGAGLASPRRQALCSSHCRSSEIRRPTAETPTGSFAASRGVERDPGAHGERGLGLALPDMPGGDVCHRGPVVAPTALARPREAERQQGCKGEKESAHGAADPVARRC